MKANLRRVTARENGEAGAELLEMALVLPILLVLLLGIIAFGRAYDVYQTITRAAREGARQAVLTVCATCPAGTCGATSTTVGTSGCIRTTYIDPALQAANLDPARVENALDSNGTAIPMEQYACLATDGSGNCTVCGIQIAFRYPYTLALPFTGLNLTTLHIPTSVQMRLENQTTPCPTGTP